ncbi:MAG: hypothetical protein H7Y04_05035 [Verrucomicrobia bacterium]|nr:hypothetical protein [Cytophagales bacterium]
MNQTQTGEKADKNQIPDRDTDKTSEKEAVEHSEENNMNKKKGYNETQADAPVNPNQNQKKEAKKEEAKKA